MAEPVSIQEGWAALQQRDAANASPGGVPPQPLAPIAQPGAGMLPGLGATLGGPSPAQEAQETQQTERGVQSPGAAVGAAATGVAQGIKQEGEAQVQEATTHPLRFALPLVTGPLGAKVATKIGGYVLRAGSPLSNAIVRAAGAAVGAVGGDILGSDPAESTPDAIARRLLVGLTYGGTEGAAVPAVQRGIERVLGRKVALVPHATEAKAILEAHGGQPTLGQLKDNWLPQWVEGILGATPLGRAVYSGARELNEQATLDAWREAIPKFGQGLDQQAVGGIVQNALANSSEAKASAVKFAYDSADALARRVGTNDNVVYVDDLIKQMYDDTAFMDKVRAGDPGANAVYGVLVKRKGQAGGLVDEEAVPIIRATKGSNHAPITFGQAEAFRQRLNSVAYDGAPGAGAATKRMAIPFAEGMDHAMDVAADQLGIPEVRAAYKAARALSAKRNETFNDPIIANLISENRTEEVAAQLYRSGDPTYAQHVYQVLENPDYATAIAAGLRASGGGTVDDVKGAIVNGYLNKVMNAAGEREASAGTEDYAQAKWNKVLMSLTSRDSPIKALVPDARERSNYEKIAQAGMIGQSEVKNAPGRIALQMAGGGMLIGILSGHGVGSFMTGVGVISVTGGLAAIAKSRPVVDYFYKKASGSVLRAAVGLGARTALRGTASYGADQMAEAIGKLRSNGIGFTYTAPDGQTTTYDPQQGVTGQYAPTAAGQAAVQQRRGSPGGSLFGRKPQGKL